MNIHETTKKIQSYIAEHPHIDQIPSKELGAFYLELLDCLVDNNHLYYIENNPILSDKEYDDLFDYLKRIEEYFPHLISGNSPTQGLIGQIAEGFTQAPHKVKLLSLENTYNAEDLLEREERIKKIIDKSSVIPDSQFQIPDSKISYTIEPKFDGLSVELIYKKGRLHQAITRGDGLVGEDITTNVKTIKNIPQRLNGFTGERLHVRGEIMMPKSVWKKINKEREDTGEQAFANTRNAAAGSIKLLDSAEVAKRGLVCFVYDILFSDQEHLERKALGLMGLPIFPREKTAEDIQDVIALCLDEQTKSYLEAQDLDFDGLVIKVQETSLRSLIGATEHHPRGAVAYKFPAQQVATKIESIDFQIGRTGIITPVANLTPVQLSGATISRTTLHNFDFIQNKDIKIGDFVWLQRSGEVIPYIVSVIKERRDGTQTTVSPPTKCPICHSTVINEDIHYYCSNESCPAQIKAQLEHFVSKNGMDIQGIGESIVDILVDQKIVANVADLWRLTDPQEQVSLQRFPGFGNKKVSEIGNQLQQAKEKPLRRLLNGLGIGHVGKKTAIMLVDTMINQYSLRDTKVSSLDNLIKHITDPDFLTNIFGIGEKTLQEIQQFFTTKKNLKILHDLEEYGINFDPIKYYKDKEHVGIFEGLSKGTFSITGSFPVSRETIIEAFQQNGYTFHESPTKTTDFMCIGEKPGSKKTKAEEYGLQLVIGRETLLQRFDFLQGLAHQEKETKVQQGLF